MRGYALGKQKSSNRHVLLPYYRSLNRIWKICLLLGISLTTVWYLDLWNTQADAMIGLDLILLVAVGLSFILAVFFFVTRFFTYVQPFQNYLKFVTPFLRMNISYRRMKSVRPVLVQQVFPKNELRGYKRNTLEPYFGKTAIVLELKSFPVDESKLRIMLPSSLFSTHHKGLVLIVPDWMKLSTEIDTFRGTQIRSIKDREWAEYRSS